MIAANDNVDLETRMLEDCEIMGLNPESLDYDYVGTLEKMVEFGQISMEGALFILANRRPIHRIVGHFFRWNGSAECIAFAQDAKLVNGFE